MSIVAGAVTIPAAEASDDELLHRLAASCDESALAAVFDRYGRVLYPFALRIVSDPEDAEEVVDDTFWQIWREAGRYDPRRGRPITWMSSICRSRALDRVRKTGRRDAKESSFRHADAPAPGPEESADPSPSANIEAHVESVDRAERVRAALASIPSEQRHVIERAYFGGLAQREIAEESGVPLGTVKTRMRLGLIKLREALWVCGDSSASEHMSETRGVDVAGRQVASRVPHITNEPQPRS